MTTTRSAVAGKVADAIVGTAKAAARVAAVIGAPIVATANNNEDSASHKNDETATASKEAQEEDSAPSSQAKSKGNLKQDSTMAKDAPNGSGGVNATTNTTARKAAHVAVTATTMKDEKENEKSTADTTTLQDTAATTILRGLQQHEEGASKVLPASPEKEDPKNKAKSPRKRAATASTTKTGLTPRSNKRVKSETSNDNGASNNKTEKRSVTPKKMPKPALPTQKKVGPRKGKGGPGSCGDGRWANKGASKRESYSTTFKAKALRDFEAWEEAQKELLSNKNKTPTVRQYVAEHNLGQKYLKFLSPKSGWRRPEVRERIMSDAASSEFKESTRLTNREVNKSYFAEMEENLVRRIEEYRERSITVSTNTIRALAKEEWLKLNIAEIEKKKSFDYERENDDDIDPRIKGPPTEFKASNGWLFNFLKRQNRKTKNGVLQEKAKASTKQDPSSGSKQKSSDSGNEDEAVEAVVVDEATTETTAAAATTATDPPPVSVPATATEPPSAAATAAATATTTTGSAALAGEQIQNGNPNGTTTPGIGIDSAASGSAAFEETAAISKISQPRHDALVAATTTATTVAEKDKHDDGKMKPQGDAAVFEV